MCMKILCEMDPDTGYPQMLGNNLANDLVSTEGAEKALNKCKAVYRGACEGGKLPDLERICSEFRIALKIAELSIQVDSVGQ